MRGESEKRSKCILGKEALRSVSLSPLKMYTIKIFFPDEKMGRNFKT